MSWQVRTTRRAERDILSIHRWILEVERRPAEARRWLDGARQAIRSLGEHPARCPLAPEAQQHRVEVRQLLFHSHRMLFLVRAEQVLILHVRHASRRPATRAELGEPPRKRGP
ncbi:MAG: type II toxin-antitoxin system RelE/ParE family toxin [Planctomycetes bacterium]|nr:type II toxin-antitoxin system RelE/ParE family toxin [Planctomycetota bacterium]